MIDKQDLQAKSDQMNAVDLVEPMTCRIVKVDYRPRQKQCISLHLDGYPGRPYKPCLGVLRGLVQVWGKDEQQWTGNLLTIFNDPTVPWGGVESGGIRISAVSGITKPERIIFQLNRSTRTIVTWDVLPDDAEPEKRFVLSHFEADIKEATDNATLDAIVKTVQKEYDADALTKIKDKIVARRQEIAAPADDAQEAEA